MTDRSIAPSPPAFDASLTDHGVEPLTARGLTYPFGEYKPEYGVVRPICDGVGWTRLPIPGFLDHINVWVLDDGDGVAIVDTGLYMDETRAAWAKALDGRPVTRVFVTHYHPDHVGSAGWLCETHDVPLWMNRTEWLYARMLASDVRDAPPAAAIAKNVAAGWTSEQLAPMKAAAWGRFASIVSPLPIGHIPLREGDTVRIGKRDWKVWLGSGHTPEHVCLVSEAKEGDPAGGLMIAGDQVLPKITSNVSMTISEPEGDPLGDWLASIQKFRALPEDLLILPAHGKPFYGLHARLDRLENGHREGLKRLHAHIAIEPRRVVDCFGMLFKRAIDDTLLGLATGEAMAHLRHLEVTGLACKEIRDGVWYYSAT
jgi:glyoxylase-like metal-dependent hydrolase (beta-lactamase superfamily II)